MARMTSEFGVLPSAALREWHRAPDLVLRVLELKGYTHWFGVLMHGKDERDFPRAGEEPMFDLVCDNHAAYLSAQRERIANR